MIQPAVLGGFLGFCIGCIVLCYILELNKEPIKNQDKYSLMLHKIINNATKLVMAFSVFLLIPILARMFELWTEVSGNTEQSLDLLRTVSSIVFSGAIGWLTAYITYQQYGMNRKLSQIEIDKKKIERDMEEMKLSEQKRKDLFKTMKKIAPAFNPKFLGYDD